MNPLWAILFKDTIRTPFSVYKMSLAEVAFLGAVLFGVGYGATIGAKKILNATPTAAEVTETVK